VNWSNKQRIGLHADDYVQRTLPYFTSQLTTRVVTYCALAETDACS